MQNQKTKTRSTPTKSQSSIKKKEEQAHAKGFDTGYLSCIADFLYADHHVEGLALLLKRLPYLFHCTHCASVRLCELVDCNDKMDVVYMLGKLCYALGETVANKNDQTAQSFIDEVQTLLRAELDIIKD